MQKLGRKRFISRLTKSPLAYIVLIIFAGLFLSSAVGAYGKNRTARSKMLEAEVELAELEEQKSKLALDLENANTPFGQEKALREKFNVVRDGEKVIMIVPEDNTANSVETLDKKGGFLSFLKKIFKKQKTLVY